MSKDLEHHPKTANFNEGEWVGITVVIFLVVAWPAYFLIKDKFFSPDPSGVLQYQNEKTIQNGAGQKD